MSRMPFDRGRFEALITEMNRLFYTYSGEASEDLDARRRSEKNYFAWVRGTKPEHADARNVITKLKGSGTPSNHLRIEQPRIMEKIETLRDEAFDILAAVPAFDHPEFEAIIAFYHGATQPRITIRIDDMIDIHSGPVLLPKFLDHLEEKIRLLERFDDWSRPATWIISSDADENFPIQAPTHALAIYKYAVLRAPKYIERPGIMRAVQVARKMDSDEIENGLSELGLI
jgi:hypothetical protein